MKRIASSVIALIILISCCFAVPATAAFRSYYISDYSAFLKPERSGGQITVTADVTASKIANSLGVSEIKIYKSNGTRVTTITGSTKNGLIGSSTDSHSPTYTYTGSSGTSYYAEVTIFVSCDSGSDSRTVTTEIAVAP